MKVHPDQLMPGCLLTKDVIGNAIHPLIPRNTVIEPIHIQVLQTFKIQVVDVAPRLVNGDVFHVEKRVQPVEDKKKNEENNQVNWTFYDHYTNAVKVTKSICEDLMRTNRLDIQRVRKLIIPLMKQAVKQPNLFLELYQYGDKQQYIYHHMVSIALLAASLAKKLNYNEGDRLKISLAAYLSDLGMISEQHTIYLQERELTEKEIENIRTHPVLSYRLIEDKSSISKDVKIAVLQHHERMDGSGYPLGVKAEKIHPFAKVIGVIDTYHAMTSERAYREKQSIFNVIEELLQRQAGKLDVPTIEALIQNYLTPQVGTRVKLSNEQIGTVVFVDESYPAHPFVQLEDASEKIINLKEQHLHIEEFLLDHEA
ncbi:HD-GYP domain-containing protein [Allobacillus sp. GCM10007491]|uniref:HD domain-containing protein n=2 Tax=Allobacillus TaxID=1400133 RepID=A0A941CY32_9BACI|nr:HD domain-containing phosphohydrolase [Allobacillus salarius]MBR7554720.1 HD domain-containing protein [Allobacillus saliphilus]TSJ63434.1 HD domain-containing protein [Allobacillus salarius]